jgi:DnaJ-domain-containing protein 1
MSFLRGRPTGKNGRSGAKASAPLLERLSRVPVIGSLISAARSLRKSTNPALVRKLIEFSELGKIEPLKRLLARGVDVNAKRHKGGRTALMKAAGNNHFEAVRMLLDHGASVNAHGGRSQKTALMRAAENNCLEAMRLLLTFGAKPDQRNVLTGRTALMIAVERGHLQAVDLLLKFHADPDVTDHRGRTALMHAVAHDHRDGQHIVLRLIQSGAALDKEDHQGKRAVDIASDAGHSHYVQLLEAHGAASGRYSRPNAEQFERSSLERAYRTLGCSNTDSADHIRSEYHALVKKYHPDSIKAFDLPQEFVDVAEKRFQEIYEAYRLVMRARNQERPANGEGQ